MNPLMFEVLLRFASPVSPKSKVLIWNMFQRFAAKNDCIPQGKVDSGDREMRVRVAVKERLGHPKDTHP